MLDHLIVIDGYNVIHRSPQLRPGVDGRTLRESRDKLVNLLAWMMGANGARFLVIFDGSEDGGPDEPNGRVEVRYSRPPDKADDLIRRIVEDQVERVDRVTVVTGDLEIARHARGVGADISLSDIFLASALGAAAGAEPSADPGADKPTTLTKKEIEDWAALFRSRPRALDDPD